MTLRSETISRSGATGLTKKSTAPLRIAETTVSSEEWAVWMMTGTAMAVARHGFHHRHAVAVGHHEVEDDGAEARVGAQEPQRLVAAGGGDRQ